MKNLNFNKRKVTLLIAVVSLLCMVFALNACEAQEPVTNPDNTTGIVGTVDPTTPTEEPTVPDETVPDETVPAEVPDETKPDENEDKPSDKTDKPSKPSEDTEEGLVTYYTTREVNLRSGRGSNYKKVGALAKGTAVQVVKGSKKSGWYKVKVEDEYCYAYAKYLSKTAPGNDSDDGGSEGTTPSKPSTSTATGVADPKKGVSWDGKSPIVYTYADGSTGTKPVEGATYERKPGVTAVYKIQRDSAGREIGSSCETCGLEVQNLSKGKYCKHVARDTICTECGEHVNANTCHTCADYRAGTQYCHHCGKVSDDGTDGTCLRWSSGGDHTCPNCKETVPSKTCHTCH